jgi:hypothetical protein
MIYVKLSSGLWLAVAGNQVNIKEDTFLYKTVSKNATPKNLYRSFSLPCSDYGRAVL